MAFKPREWYCKPVKNGVWSKAVENAFGAYTPCASESLVLGISYLILLALSLYRIWLIKRNVKVQRFCLRSNLYNYFLGLLAAYCTAEPLFKLVMGISAFNVDGQDGLAPYQAWNPLLVLSENVFACRFTCYLGLWNCQSSQIFLALYLQIVSLIVEAFAWCSVILMIVAETKIYIRETRWFVRFAVIYALVGEGVMLNLVLSVREYCRRLVF